MMLIGDEAIWYANRHQPSSVLDLGAAWSDWTGLPFVYAVWAVQRGLGDDGLVQRLRDAKRAGLAHLEQIVQDSDEASPAFRREYLTKNVCYDLDGGGKRGVRRFQDALCAMQLLPQSHDLRYLS